MAAIIVRDGERRKTEKKKKKKGVKGLKLIEPS